MDKKIIEIPAKTRQELQNAPSRLLRVCAYCRVSTDSEEQESSYETQVEYYSQYISKNNSWHFVGIYADKGLSGKSAKNRPQFMKMIDECKQGNIDMIITKSISRFARNTRDSIDYIRTLRELGVAIYFEKESLNSLDKNIDLILSILSSIAEEESRNTSTNIKSAFKHNASMGKVTHMCSCYGYYLTPEKSLAINHTEANIVNRIFLEFIEGCAISSIAKMLKHAGVPTPSGKSFSWHRTVIRNILLNEKYVGDILFQKTYSTDFLCSRKKNKGEVKKWLLQNAHPPIISRETFEQAQNLLNNASPRYTKVSERYILSSKISCKLCGRNFKHTYFIRDSTLIYTWTCHGRKKCGCKNNVLREEDIFNAYFSLSSDYNENNLRDKVFIILVDNKDLTFIFNDDSQRCVTIKGKTYRAP